MKILFQGDSITDAGRDKRNYHDLGNGYPKFAAAALREACPDTDIEFINFGISGNRTSQLFDRLYEKCMTIEGVDTVMLRDMLLYDRISHNNSCVIPKSIRIKDEKLGAVVRALCVKRPMLENVRRCVGILYHNGHVIYADYTKKHPVSELYEVIELDADELLCEEWE